MRKNLIILMFLLVTFWACENPMGPEIEEALEQADIRIEVNSIGHNSDEVKFTVIFKEKNGVEAELRKLWMLNYYRDGQYFNKSFEYLCPKKLRAGGELKIEFDYYTGDPLATVEVNAKFLDKNGHEHHVKKKFSIK